jgi:thiol-disulfide isomerase/thioredoxin
MKRFLIIVIIAVSNITFVFSQVPAYKLDFKIGGLKDTTLLLGHYLIESTYAKDTAKSVNGVFSFDGEKKLPPGIYFVIKGKIKLFELLIGSNQQFQMTTSTKDYVANMKVTGDYDNQLFFDDMRFNVERNIEAGPYIKVMQDSAASEEAQKTAREALMKINDKVMAYRDGIIAKYPESFTAKLFKISKKIEVPEPPKRADGTIDSTFQLRYYREHYFDNFDLGDEALVRLNRNVYKEKVDEYLDKLFVPEADTLTVAINKLIAKAKNNQETYKYLTFMCMQKYVQPKYMGLDQIFVNLYDQYVATGEMNYWMNDKFKQNFKEQADRIRSSALGKKSNNLILKDVNGNMRSLHGMTNKYTVLFIYDPDCGHCKKETPKLVDFKNTTKLDVGVYTVSTDTSMTKTQKYVKEMKMEKFVNTCFYYSAVGLYRDLYDAETTPTIYILDKEKTIIGRKIPAAEEIGPFIERYEKFQQVKAKAASSKTSP